jgi:uncharacterized protein (DUF433 family)
MSAAFDIGTLLDSGPTYFGGRPFIRGKRVTVQRIGIVYNEGRSPERIADDLILTLPEVHAALAYYFANREAIDADIKEQDEEYDRLAAAHSSLVDKVRNP